MLSDTSLMLYFAGTRTLSRWPIATDRSADRQNNYFNKYLIDSPSYTALSLRCLKVRSKIQFNSILYTTLILLADYN